MMSETSALSASLQLRGYVVILPSLMVTHNSTKTFAIKLSTRQYSGQIPPGGTAILGSWEENSPGPPDKMPKKIWKAGYFLVSSPK